MLTDDQRRQIAEALHRAEVDRVQIHQVLLNLVINGIEAMSTVPSRARRLRISRELDATGSIRVTVTDHGGGIAEGQLGQLFEPFFTTKPDGMGMGLAISRSIVEAHDGRLWVEATSDAGSSFVMTLPAEPVDGR